MPQDRVTFAINGKMYSVNEKAVGPDTSLNTFIRDHALLKGTKYMCNEGNCGACVVTVQHPHPVTKRDQFCSINSCLMPVLACHGSSITTIEGLGNKLIGYHNLQKLLAETNGTQCGFCSPGMVMNMYSLQRCNPNFTAEDVERAFGGHVCRCTGYRPILQAFRSSGTTERDERTEPATFVEQTCAGCKCESGEVENTMNFAELALVSKSFTLEFKDTNSKWYKVSSVNEIMQVLDLIGRSSYMLLAGNASQGLYPSTSEVSVFIDVRDVRELQHFRKTKDRLVIGGNMTLADAMQLFKKTSQDDPVLFGYATVLADHLEQVATVSIRNAATIAGNLMTKYNHREFSSDIFLLFETVGAKLKINELNGRVQTVSMVDFLKMNMNKKIITSVELPAISSNHYVLKTYKIMPRKQNALTLLGAGFLFRVMNEGFTIEEKPKIVFNGVNKNFVHATEAEAIMTGKSIFDESLMEDVMTAMIKDIPSEITPSSPSTEYKRKLAGSLIYKFLLSVGNERVKDFVRSGGEVLARPISSGTQVFTSSPANVPVGQPMQKLEALAQCSGEAEYVDDIPKYQNELFASFILANEAAATIHSVDPSPALVDPKIVAFLGPDDIPGVNSFGGIPPYLPEDEEIFCSGRVQYAGQPVGVLVGATRNAVLRAAKKVLIKYSAKGEPMLNLKDAVEQGDASRIILQNKIEASESKGNTKFELEGELELGSQYHYTTEPLSCLTVPTDLGVKVFPTSQWIQSVQSAVAQCLKISENSVEVEVKRIGGGFGSKMTRTGQLAAACSLAAFKLRVPVRMVLDFATSMKTIGKRCPALTKYSVSVDENGVVQKMSASIFVDYGVTLNDPLEEEAMRGFVNCYASETWSVSVFAVKTDNIRTYARGPGSLEGMTSIERIMDHIAQITGKDPIEVRLANTNSEDLTVIQEMIGTVKTSSDYDTRSTSIQSANKENRWRKRGISLVPIKFMICFAPSYYGTVTIFPGDGSVSITTGGIEMGQGINTKAVQVCAFALGIELEKVNVVASRGLTSPGNFPSGSSITSDSVCSAILSCCNELKKRFEPIKEKTGSANWVDLVKAANMEGISLIAVHSFSPGDENPKDYPVYGAAVVEVEVDVLTGQYQILRADILEDAGESLNPTVDIGQIEGGFAMGLGYFTSENIVCDSKTGDTLTCSSSDYWPPGVGDIPIDFRVELRKNAPNPLGVLRSKATGEPPLCMSCALPLALTRAVAAARSDAGVNSKIFDYGQPCTVEKTFLACGTAVADYKM